MAPSQWHKLGFLHFYLTPAPTLCCRADVMVSVSCRSGSDWLKTFLGHRSKKYSMDGGKKKKKNIGRMKKRHRRFCFYDKIDIWFCMRITTWLPNNYRSKRVSFMLMIHMSEDFTASKVDFRHVSGSRNKIHFFLGREVAFCPRVSNTTEQQMPAACP